MSDRTNTDAPQAVWDEIEKQLDEFEDDYRRALGEFFRQRGEINGTATANTQSADAKARRVRRRGTGP